MAGNEGGSILENYHFVDPAFGLHRQEGARGQVLEKNAAFNLGPNDVAIHPI